MKKQTLSDKEKLERLKKAARLVNRSAEYKLIEKRERLIQRLQRKSARPPRRVKPKPKSRMKNRVTVVRIGGQKVEGIEDEFTSLE